MLQMLQNQPVHPCNMPTVLQCRAFYAYTYGCTLAKQGCLVVWSTQDLVDLEHANKDWVFLLGTCVPPSAAQRLCTCHLSGGQLLPTRPCGHTYQPCLGKPDCWHLGSDSHGIQLGAAAPCQEWQTRAASAGTAWGPLEGCRRHAVVRPTAACSAWAQAPALWLAGCVKGDVFSWRLFTDSPPESSVPHWLLPQPSGSCSALPARFNA